MVAWNTTATKISKQFTDRYKKLIGDVRAIDPKQVPTDVNLMGILTESVIGEQVLWGYLSFAKNITLEEMMDVVAKWRAKFQNFDAVANYTALPGNSKKVYGKKQRLGRGSGKDQVWRQEHA